MEPKVKWNKGVPDPGEDPEGFRDALKNWHEEHNGHLSPNGLGNSDHLDIDTNAPKNSWGGTNN